MPFTLQTKPLLRCEQCGRRFELSTEELERLRALRLPSPHTCPACRAAPTEAAGPSVRQSATCADCGTMFDLKVRPRGHRQRFYCESCFRRRVEARYGGGRAGDRIG